MVNPPDRHGRTPAKSGVAGGQSDPVWRNKPLAQRDRIQTGNRIVEFNACPLGSVIPSQSYQCGHLRYLGRGKHMNMVMRLRLLARIKPALSPLFESYENLRREGQN